jgi:hypothetical protein
MLELFPVGREFTRNVDYHSHNRECKSVPCCVDALKFLLTGVEFGEGNCNRHIDHYVPT